MPHVTLASTGLAGRCNPRGRNDRLVSRLFSRQIPPLFQT